MIFVRRRYVNSSQINFELGDFKRDDALVIAIQLSLQ